MIGISENNERIEMPHETFAEDNRICIKLSKETNFESIKQIEADYFGEIAGADDSGYMVLPRGDGCKDYSLCFFSKHKEDFEREIKESNIPFFGVKTEKQCFLAIITGMSYDYTLKIIRKDGKYRIFPVYEINGEQPYEDLKVEYFELCGEDADYSGMARRYRKYKIEKENMLPVSERLKNSDSLKYSANSVMIRIRCGWKPAPPQIRHQTLENEPPMHVACDFDRISDILDELKKQGVDAAEICLVGWNVKGHDGRWPQTLPVCEELGGEQKLRSLIKKAQDMGYQITCHTNSTDQYEIADIYDIENTRLDRFGKPIKRKYGWSGGETNDLCPQISYEQALQILPSVAELGFKGTHYIDVMGIVHPRRCYHKKHYVDSAKAVEYYSKIAKLSTELFGGFSSEGAYDFITPWLDFGLYISFSHEYDGICDKPIPFWQLVYHGYVLSNPYSETVNPTFKSNDIQLNLVEYGGRPSYYFYSKFMNDGNNWMGNTDALCDTDEQLHESVMKIKKGADEYKKLSELQLLFMEKHEEVSDNVFKVTYSDGTAVIVDYNSGKYDIIKNSKKHM